MITVDISLIICVRNKQANTQTRKLIHVYRPVKKNGALYYSNKNKTIDHNDLNLSGIHIYSWPHVSYKSGNDTQRNKVIATILVKEATPV